MSWHAVSKNARKLARMFGQRHVKK